MPRITGVQRRVAVGRVPVAAVLYPAIQNRVKGETINKLYIRSGPLAEARSIPGRRSRPV
jgi:hypothetical protein